MEKVIGAILLIAMILFIALSVRKVFLTVWDYFKKKKKGKSGVEEKQDSPVEKNSPDENSNKEV